MATLQELRILHTSDRVAYSRLINSLGLDPRTSTQVMAFWNWVKRCGHRDFVHKILPLQDIELQTLVKETIRCIRSLYMDLPMNPFVSIDLQPPFMQSILGSDFSERFIQENRDSAMRTMFMFIKDVAEKIFHDLVIVAPLLPQRLAQTRSTQMVTLNLLAQEARSGPPAQTQSTTQIKNRSLSAQAEANVIPRLPPRSPSSDLSQKERILFMTFSKGHPILKEELNEFITRYITLYYTIKRDFIFLFIYSFK